MWPEIQSLLKGTCKAAKTFLEKAPSRKFLAWAVATHMTYTGILAPDSWLMVTLLFMSIQTALDWKKVNAPTIGLTNGTLTLPEPGANPEVPAGGSSPLQRMPT